ncbi:hypothetical protein N431DRAFT_532400 [Stipitochalara longipes BDJ]|nr:hypothetical protein N431DRAFT_532400 [Stipitochalara longipes BDJ]
MPLVGLADNHPELWDLPPILRPIAGVVENSKDKLVKPFAFPIALLSVSHEAVALDNYQLPFQGILGLERVYFHVKSDILFIQDRSTIEIVSKGLLSQSECGKGREEVRHLMYSGWWQHMFPALKYFGELETFVVEDWDVNVEWEEDQLSSYLGFCAEASKDFRVTLKTAEEMNKLAELSINP